MGKTVYGNNIKTEDFIVMYPILFEPKLNKMSNKLKYSMTMLFDKNKTDIKELKDEVLRVANEAFGKVKGLKLPIKDGDKMFTEDGEKKTQFEGYWVVSASNNEEYRPVLVDQKVKPLKDKGAIYSGAILKALVKPMSYDVGVAKGVKLAINGVQKVADGEKIGYAFNPEEAFEPIQTTTPTKSNEPSFDDIPF